VGADVREVAARAEVSAEARFGVELDAVEARVVEVDADEDGARGGGDEDEPVRVLPDDLLAPDELSDRPGRQDERLVEVHVLELVREARQLGAQARARVAEADVEAVALLGAEGRDGDAGRDGVAPGGRADEAAEPCGGRGVNLEARADEPDDAEVGRVRGAEAARVFGGDVEAAADVQDEADAARKRVEAGAVVREERPSVRADGRVRRLRLV
jgi:hypothetical protein